MQREMAKMRPVCPAETMDAEDTLFRLYTSGSTGRPKAQPRPEESTPYSVPLSTSLPRREYSVPPEYLSAPNKSAPIAPVSCALQPRAELLDYSEYP